MAVVSLLTAQNTLGVQSVSTVEPTLVAEQLDTLLEDITPHAAKTGALGEADTITTLAERAADFNFPVQEQFLVIA